MVSSTDSNALGPASAAPTVTSDGPAVPGVVHVATVHLGDRDPAALPQVTTRKDGTTPVAEVSWPDGSADTLRLPDPESTSSALRKDRYGA